MAKQFDFSDKPIILLDDNDICATLHYQAKHTALTNLFSFYGEYHPAKVLVWLLLAWLYHSIVYQAWHVSLGCCQIKRNYRAWRNGIGPGRLIWSFWENIAPSGRYTSEC